MATTKSNKVPFGLNEAGELVYVSQVPTGDACGCICPDPACAKPLTARNDPFPGRKRTIYFCHKSATPGCGGRESALHRMGKEVLAKAGQLLLPAWSALDGELQFHPVMAILPPGSLTEVSLREGQMRPDLDVMALLGRTVLQPLYVEIKVTHAVDWAKRERVIAQGYNMVEIDLADVPDEVLLDEATFSEHLLRRADNRHWVHLCEPTIIARQSGREIIEVKDTATQKREVEWKSKKGHWIVNTQGMFSHSPDGKDVHHFQGELQSHEKNGVTTDFLGNPVPYKPGLYVRARIPRGPFRNDEADFKTALRPIVQDTPLNAQKPLL